MKNLLNIPGISGLLLLIVVAGINSEVIGDVDYGHPCKQRDDPDSDQTTLCNLSKNLICMDTVNICACQSHMYFDEGLNKCIVYEGEKCLEVVNDGQFPSVCTTNAICEQSAVNVPGICKCLFPEFIPTQFGFCKMSHGSGGCQNKSDCSLDAFLTCNMTTNTCICDRIRSVWNPTIQRCVGMFQEICDPETQRDCIPGAECNSGRCQCITPEYLDWYGICYLTINQTCLQSSECLGDLQCLPTADPINSDKKCGCTDGQYPSGANVCSEHRKDGNVCDADYWLGDAFNQCVDHATCKNATGFESWHCQCDDGYSATYLDTCLATLGTDCLNTSDCNSDELLTCQSGICSCPPGEELIGSVCKAMKLIGDSCTSTTECMGSSICNNRQCSCQSGSSVSADRRRCLWNYYRLCSLDENDVPLLECNSQMFLECSDTSSLCECEDAQNIMYSGTSEVPCVAQPESHCYENFNNRTLRCHQSSTCVDITTDGRGTCKCNQEFSLDSDIGLCIRNAGSTVRFVNSIWLFLSLYAVNILF